MLNVIFSRRVWNPDINKTYAKATVTLLCCVHFYHTVTWVYWASSCRELEDENLSRTSVWGPNLSRGFTSRLWPTVGTVSAQRVNLSIIFVHKFNFIKAMLLFKIWLSS